MLRAGLLLLSFALLALQTGCFFEFDRGRDLQPGEVRGRAVFDDGVGAPFARVRVLGSSRVETTRHDGAFSVRGLPAGGWALRADHDDDGDGLPEHAATRFVEMTTTSTGEVTGLLLGDVVLQGTASLRGRVTLDGNPVPGAEVLVYGPAQLAELQVELPVEARTASDSNGAFRLDAIAPGDVLITAFADGAAAAPVAVTLAPEEARDGIVIELVSDPAPRDVEIVLLAPPTLQELVRLDLVRAGSQRPVVDPSTLNLSDDNVFAGSSSLRVEVPVGHWDAYLTTRDGRRGTLLGLVVTPPGPQNPRYGPVWLTTQPTCALYSGGEIVSGARDCDGDTLRGLPAIPDIFTECAPQCADAFGTAGALRSCETSAGVFDCDDDGDGQPDVTAPIACYGVEAGSDHDGDGVCDRADPFPDCAANDADDASCGADRPRERPRPDVRPEFSGQPGADAGPDDDAGPTDGGPNVDAGRDDSGVPLLPISFVPAQLAFGPVVAPLADDRTLLLHNDGTTAVDVELVSSDPAFIVLPPASAQIAPGLQRAFTVRFGADTAGDFTGTLRVVHDVTGFATPELAVTGTATADVGQPLVRASRTSVGLGAVVVGEQTIATLTLQNDGDGVAVVDGVTGLPAGLRVATSLPLVLAPGQAAALALVFAPEAEGPVQGTLTLTGVLGASVVIEVTGAGVAATTFSPLAPPLALRLPAGGQNGENEIRAATASAVSFAVDLPPTAVAGDDVTVTLDDGAGGLAVTTDTLVGGDTVTVVVDASGLADGLVRASARLARGPGASALVSEPALLDVSKSTSALPLPVVNPPPELTANDRVTITGTVGPFTAGTDARVYALGGAFEESASVVGGASPEAFSLDVTLRRNTQNLLTVCYTDGTDTACAAPVSVVHLVPDELVVASVDSRPLTTAEVEQLVENGVISLDDPDNFHVQEFTVVLQVGGDQVAITQPVVLPAPGTGASGGVYYGGCSGCSGGGSSSIVIVQPPGGLPPIPGVIVIDGQLKSLKELFQVTLALSNTSDVLTLENVAAQALVPSGLTAIRAALGDTVGDVTVDDPVDDILLGTIAPGDTGVAQFILRGDVAGDYNVRVDFGGEVTGPGLSDPVPFDGSASTRLSVFGPPTFDIRLVHPSSVVFDQTYDMQVSVTNTSPITAHYTTLTLRVGTGAVAATAACPATVPSVFELDLGHLEPGQRAVRTVRLRSCLTGPITGCSVTSDERLSVDVIAGPSCPAGADDVPTDLPQGFDAPGVLAVSPLPNRVVDGAALADVQATLSGEVANVRADTFGDPNNAGTFSAPGTLFVERLELAGSGVIARVPATLQQSFDAGADETSATLTFVQPLAADARYRVTLRGGSGGLRNANSGLPLAGDFTWVFITQPVNNGVAPVVETTYPLDNASATPGASVQVRFSERIAPSSVTVNLTDYKLGTFAVVQGATVGQADLVGGTALAGALSLSPDGRTLSYAPSPPLPAGGSFHVRVAGITDVFGTPLAGLTLVGFDTGPADVTPPAAPVVDPVARYTAASGVLVEGRTEPWAIVDVTGGALAVQKRANALGRFAVAVPLAANTDHTFTVRATDLNGNQGPGQSVDTAGDPLTCTRDLTPPVLTIASPSAGTTVSGAASPIAYMTSDPVGPGVDRVRAVADGLLLNEQQAAAGTITINTEQLDNGARTIELWARDAVGNWGGPFTLAVVVDNPARPRIDAVAGNDVTPGATTRLTLSGDNLETATAVSATPAGVTAVLAGTSGFDLLVDVTVPAATPPGALSLSVDNDDGTGTTTEAGLSLYIRAPTLNIAAPAPARPHKSDADRTITLTGSGFIASTEVLIGGATVATTVQGGSSLTFTLPLSLAGTPGAYEVVARTADPVLGARLSNTRTLTVVEPVFSFAPATLTQFAGDDVSVDLVSSEPAEAGGLAVSLVFDDDTVGSAPAQITIPAGQTSVSVDVTAVAAGAAVLTASAPLAIAGDLSLTVLPPPVPELEADALRVQPLLSRDFTVTLDQPALPGGLDIDLVLTGSAASLSAAQVTVLEGETEATFTLDGLSPGDETLTATTPYDTSDQADVLVKEALASSNPDPVRAAATGTQVFIDVATDGTNDVSLVEIVVPALWSTPDATAVVATLDGQDVSAQITRGTVGAEAGGGTLYSVDLAATPIEPQLTDPVLQVTFDDLQAFEVLGPSEWVVRADKGVGTADVTRDTFVVVDGTAADGAGVATVTSTPDPLPAATPDATVTLELTNDVEIVTDPATLFADFTRYGAALNWALVDNATYGPIVRTTQNGAPSYFVSPDAVGDGVIEAEIGALTGSDDDFIGFVFRWQDPCNFYLFDWKQANQGASLEGRVLRRFEDCDFNGDGTGGENITSDPLFNNNVADRPNIVATDYSTTLGWVDNTFHNVRIVLDGSYIEIYVDDVLSLTFDDPDPYLSGGYGPYTDSQPQTSVRNVRVSRASALVDIVEVELPTALGSPTFAVDVDGTDRTGDVTSATGSGGGTLLTLPGAALLPSTGLYTLTMTGVTAPAEGSYPFVVRTAGTNGNREEIVTAPALVTVP